MNEEFFEGVGGLKLFLRSWRSDGRVRGIVVINHGFKSHSGLYEWVAERLSQRGLVVYALDMRGHGKSEGERLYIGEFSEYVGDLAILVSLAKSRNPGLPTFLLGHSAGGVVGCVYALDHQSEIDGFICESFAHEVPAPDFALAILKGIGHVAPHAHVLKLKDEDFSRDPEFVERMKSDPLIVHEGYTSQAVAELVRADERLRREFEAITLPLLIVHGTDDHAAKPHGSQRFYDSAGSADKTLKFYEGYYHDLLNDRNREIVMSDILDWIAVHIASARSTREHSSGAVAPPMSPVMQATK